MSEFVIDIILVIVYLSVLITLCCVVWSVWRGWRNRSKVKPEEKLAQRTSLGVAAFTVLLVGASLLCSSAQPLRIAGQMYTDGLWLRVADMFVYTIGVMIMLLLLGMVLFWINKRFIHYRR